MARPQIEITPELCKQAESLAAQGLTMEQLARVLGMGISTLYEKKAEYTELLEAIKDGQAKGVAVITNALFESAKGGNLGAQCFYLKNRAGWRDKMEFSGELKISKIERVIVEPQKPKTLEANVNNSPN